MSKETYSRMDFVTKRVIKSDKNSGKITVELIPNPERYEWKEIAGDKVLYDRLEKIYITEEALEEGIKTLSGKPIYYQPQLMTDSYEYFKGRVPYIIKEIYGDYVKPTFEDKSEKFLQSLEKDELGFVILSLDIVSSTKLATTLDPKKYKDIIAVILFEISRIVPLFRGYVLKYTGDGIIAYFPEPSFIAQNDLALDCSLTLRGLIYGVINPIFKKLNYPEINIRVGLDSGDAYVETIGNPSAKQHKDIIGKVVNLAAKIQSIADVGGISLGEITYRNIYTDYKKLCIETVLPDKWDYKKENNEPYKIYKLSLTSYSVG